MNKLKWKIIFAAALLTISALLFTAQYLIFKDAYNISFYIFHGIAFIPIQVIIVGLFLDGIMERKEKEKVMKKLNMVIGLFFSEVGSKFVRTISCYDKNLYASLSEFEVKENYTLKELKKIKSGLCKYQGQLEMDVKTLSKIKEILLEKKDFMVLIIANPVLLEHDTFTELLMATFHIAEEFSNREDIPTLSKDDLDHIRNDVSRAYSYIVLEWFDYIIYLKKEYPYLYKSAILTNPFLGANACSI